jgi:hypothetical protein
MTATVAFVVADTGTGAQVAAHAWVSACSQLRESDRIAWISDRAIPDASDSRCSWQVAAADMSRGELYGLGLTWASITSCDVVAFTDSGTRLEPGWRCALEGALDAGTDVVGGPVVPGWISDEPGRGAISWAGFLSEYAPHAAPPYVSATGDLSANNVAYRLGAVSHLGGHPFWKSVVDHRLRAAGHRLALAPAMVASSIRPYSTRDLTTARAAAGRLYGCQSGEAMSIARRVIRVAACAALPVVRLARVARAARRDPTLARAMRRALLGLVVAELAWSLGEAAGYSAPGRPPSGVR